MHARSLLALTLVLLLPLACSLTGPAASSSHGSKPERGAEWTSALQGTEALPGLLTVHLQRAEGRVLLELPAPARAGEPLFTCLWAEGLRAGLGSNPVGLDRGQWGQARVLEFRRMGPRVLVMLPNLRHGLASGDAHEQRAAQESFAPAVLWAGKVLAEDPDGALLVDFTSFVVADAHGSADALAGAGQGRFSLDRDRSLLDPDATLAFPRNLEFEALLTFSSEDPGWLVRSAAADGRSVTLVQHHSLVALPEPGFEPRPLDPRAGAFAVTLRDVSAPLDQAIERNLAVRHRLQRAADGSVLEPIVYYVDRGAPEPVRSALLDGARWWESAFAAAGWPGAFRVELMPEDLHPLDVRHNVIEWVHRTTRGWSYGNAVTDPRTGEILKGHVSLGSLRVRQDRLIFEGLLGTAATGSGAADDPIELSLARIRQLSAHEVGHTLGLAHHFAASRAGNGSVMDYPAPRLGLLPDGELDLSEVYGVGTGPWDDTAISWLYRDVPNNADGRAELDRILSEGLATAPGFLSDSDARPASSAHPAASLWDTGDDAVAALQRSLAVRRLGLSRFGVDRVPAGQPLSEAALVFAPLWLHHRYQLDAALKVLGGVEYSHALAGVAAPAPAPADAAWQRAALNAVLSVLDPSELDVPDNALAVLVPRTPEEPRSEEALPSRSGPVFDPLEAAAVAAEQVIAGMLHPARASRLLDQQRLHPGQPGLDEVLAALLDACVIEQPLGPRQAAVADRVEAVLLRQLAELSSSDATAPPAAARAEQALQELGERFARLTQDGEPSRQAPRAALARAVTRQLSRPAPSDRPLSPARETPPGSPIGSDLPHCGWDSPSPHR